MLFFPSESEIEMIKLHDNDRIEYTRNSNQLTYVQNKFYIFQA